MRELKFRVWYKVLGEDFKTDGCYYYNSLGEMWLTIEQTARAEEYILKKYANWAVHIVKEEYTGLKDKNGKEIYEGDIIRNIEEVAPNKSKTYQVFYKVDFAKFDVAPVDGKIDILSGGFNFASMAHYEVIGNIHENPELLKTK